MKALFQGWCKFSVVLVVSACSGQPVAVGGTVTFRFDAEINHILSGIPFDSGVEFAEGDVVNGYFTFDPSHGDGSNPFIAAQPYEFALILNEVELSTSVFDIRSWNDNAITDSLISYVDDLQLTGDGFVAHTSDGAILSSIKPILSGFSMSLVGKSDAFPQPIDPEGEEGGGDGQLGLPGGFQPAIIPASASIWNALDLERQLIVSLRNEEGGMVGFQAAIGTVRVVPEPRTIWNALVVFAALIGLHVKCAARSDTKQRTGKRTP